jgi:hypothetical protein
MEFYGKFPKIWLLTRANYAIMFTFQRFLESALLYESEEQRNYTQNIKGKIEICMLLL